MPTLNRTYKIRALEESIGINGLRYWGVYVSATQSGSVFRAFPDRVFTSWTDAIDFVNLRRHGIHRGYRAAGWRTITWPGSLSPVRTFGWTCLECLDRVDNPVGHAEWHERSKSRAARAIAEARANRG